MEAGVLVHTGPCRYTLEQASSERLSAESCGHGRVWLADTLERVGQERGLPKV